MDFLCAVPEIPDDLLHEMEEIVEGEGYVDEEIGRASCRERVSA